MTKGIKLYHLIVEDWFSSAHQLREYQGKCENLHGHNWKVELEVCGEELGSVGMLMDFGDLKKILKGIMDTLDHKFLNELEPFDKINPTSELIAKYIADTADEMLAKGVHVYKVTVWESEKCRASYLR